MGYLLDTNAVIALLKSPNGPVSRALALRSPSDVFVSSIVLHELYYGAFKSQRREANVEVVDELLFEVLAFELEDAREAGEVRALLAAAGTPIGPLDVLIAGQARARGLTMVTDNIGEFRRVDRLRVESWSV